jgi:hypothetical protein
MVVVGSAKGSAVLVVTLALALVYLAAEAVARLRALKQQVHTARSRTTITPRIMKPGTNGVFVDLLAWRTT